MNINSFYDIIDGEILEIISRYEDDEYFQNTFKTDENKKSYGFLIWFLTKYMDSELKNLSEYDQYIVEGNDDNSCDIIFSNNCNGEEIFYIVQAKWFNKKKILKSNETSKEFKACITDLKLILSGKKSKSPINSRFNKKYEELLEHKAKNRKIRFVFAALCTSNKDHRIKEVEDNSSDELLKTYIYDINMIKERYIDVNYRDYKMDNPLENTYINSFEVELEIEKNNYIQINQPNLLNECPHNILNECPHNRNGDSYIFIIKPKDIYDLYKTHGNTLFLSNIRNHVGDTDTNISMKETINESPEKFWYFNNGITAITNKVYPFYEDSGLIKLKGLQIINGAQTFKTIYDAYCEADAERRVAMDKNMKVTVRIITSRGKEFDLNVTRYTNSQNNPEVRDFRSNDYVQERLYKEILYNTEYVYDRRKGEFKDPNPLKLLSNEDLAQCYLVCHLKQPYSAKNETKNIFKSISEKGFYEEIFNKDTNYKDLMNSYLLCKHIEQKHKELSEKDSQKYKKYYKNLKFEISALVYSYIIETNKEKGKDAVRDIMEGMLKGPKYDKIDKIFDEIILFIETHLDSIESNGTSIDTYCRRKSTYDALEQKMIEFLLEKDIVTNS